MLLSNARLATMHGSQPYGLIDGGAIAIEAGRIAWAGATPEIPAQFSDLERHDLDGRLIRAQGPGLQ